MGTCDLGLRKEQLTRQAGTVLLHDLAQRLGVERLLEEELRVTTRARGDGEGHAMSGLVYHLIWGGAQVSALDVWRGDPGTQEWLAVETSLAPTTAGEFLRQFALGAGHDWPRGQRQLHQQVRPPQQATPCTIALDSSRSEPAAASKAGSTKAYTGEGGYPPVCAVGAEEGEVRFSPLRRGSAPTARTRLWGLRPEAPARPGHGGQEAAGGQRLL